MLGYKEKNLLREMIETKNFEILKLKLYNSEAEMRLSLILYTTD